MFEGLKTIFNVFVIMFFAAVPLAIWKLVDIVIWLIKQIVIKWE